MFEKGSKGREEGIALILAVIIALFLTILGLGLTMFSISEFSSGREYESHQRAFAIADSGFNLMKTTLQGQDMTTLLANYTTVPEYVNTAAASGGIPPPRDPVYPVDARSIDYANPPQPLGSISVPGLLTPASGTSLGTGYFFARISDNTDGDGDMSLDSDYTVYMRVVGVSPAPLAEISSNGGFARNSVSIIETMVKRDTSFNLGAPLSIAGPDVDMRINGTAFDIVGDEDHPGVSVFYDDESGGDGATASQAVYDSMNNPNQGKQIVGAEGDYGPHPEPSIRDDTDLIRNSGDPDARNVLNPNFLYNFTQSIASLADYRYSGNTHLSGRTELGTEGSPAITFVDGDLKLSGSGSGYGILVVTGTMDYSGAFDFDGLVLIIGEGSVDIRGANKDITGGMLIANLEESGGEHVFGVPDIWLRGNSGFFFDSTSIHMALGLLPLKTLMWREITPDIEPAMAGS